MDHPDPLGDPLTRIVTGRPKHRATPRSSCDLRPGVGRARRRDGEQPVVGR
jgi:hypothetical protein